MCRHQWSFWMGDRRVSVHPPAPPLLPPIPRIAVTYPFSVADPGSTVWAFATGNTCLPTSDPTSSCTRGNYPVYVINATCPAHIQIGVIFTRLFNIRLIIKNTGHDF